MYFSLLIFFWILNSFLCSMLYVSNVLYECEFLDIVDNFTDKIYFLSFSLLKIYWSNLSSESLNVGRSCRSPRRWHTKKSLLNLRRTDLLPLSVPPRLFLSSFKLILQISTFSLEGQMSQVVSGSTHFLFKSNS